MYIPSYFDCEKIVSANSVFCKKVDTIDGYDITQYSYRMSSISDFRKPIASSMISAYELRGICFIHPKSGNISKLTRYPMMHKFFNLNEGEGFMYSDIVKKEIDYVQEKVDGSLIRFIRLPSGRVIAKTNFAFESDQAAAAMKIYESNSSIRKIVDATLDKEMTALFEYVSPMNQIVLRYDTSELRLLAMRRPDGSYVPKFTIESCSDLYGIPIAKFYKCNNIDEYIERARNDKDIEGWVITFSDGQKIKLKTHWYFALHRIVTSSIKRENDLIESIINGTIDDILSAIPEDSIEYRNTIENISRLVVDYINITSEYILKKVLTEYSGDRKNFVLKNSSDEYFDMMMYLLRDPTHENAVNIVCSTILKHTHSLSDARKFLDKISKIVK